MSDAAADHSEISGTCRIFCPVHADVRDDIKELFESRNEHAKMFARLEGSLGAVKWITPVVTALAVVVVQLALSKVFGK